MELVELRTTSLAEAMFDKLGLPKPVYHVCPLEQGGFRSQIEFHRTRERYDALKSQTKLMSHTCVSGEAAMDHAADLAITYMQNNENKQEKQAHARLSNRVLEKTDEINQRNKTIKQMTEELSNYLEEVHVVSNKIHDLAATALDPAASLSLSTLKQTILEIQNSIGTLGSTTATARVFLEEKGMYSEDDVPQPTYDGLSDEELDEDYHQDMDDDCANYVRSP
ncbi:hypothetical protein VPH35_116244 [Triticum aestivum]